MSRPDKTRRYSVFVIAGSFLMAGISPAIAQSDAEAPDGETLQDVSVAKMLQLEKGPCLSSLGDQAEIKVPAQYTFADAEKTRTMMRMFENPVNQTEVGCVMSPDEAWFAVFEFDAVGYVKDDDKASLDADDLWKALVEGNKVGNEERKRNGWTPINLTGWVQKPKYDEETNNLEWAIRLESDGEEVVNHNTRILGRRGYMTVTLVVDPDQMEATLPEYRSLLRGFQYTDGNRYAQFQKGDKIAEYGLAALITGGAAAVAIKSGLLQRFWKLIVIGVAAAGAGIRKLFRRTSTA